jgi:hypothetical protein
MGLCPVVLSVALFDLYLGAEVAGSGLLWFWGSGLLWRLGPGAGARARRLLLACGRALYPGRLYALGGKIEYDDEFY